MLIWFNFLSFNFAVASESVVNSAIERAETAMISAFKVVVEAEDAGGNVSSLLTPLNRAGDFLADARMSYKKGDFERAAYFADLSRNLSEQVKNEAYELRNWAWSENIQYTRFAVTASIFGVSSVILWSFWFWRVLKRWYVRRVLKMKPEVAPADS